MQGKGIRKLAIRKEIEPWDKTRKRDFSKSFALQGRDKGEGKCTTA